MNRYKLRGSDSMLPIMEFRWMWLLSFHRFSCHFSCFAIAIPVYCRSRFLCFLANSSRLRMSLRIDAFSHGGHLLRVTTFLDGTFFSTAENTACLNFCQFTSIWFVFGSDSKKLRWKWSKSARSPYTWHAAVFVTQNSVVIIALFFVISLIIDRSAFLARSNNLCSSEKNFTVRQKLERHDKQATRQRPVESSTVPFAKSASVA